MSNRGKSLPGRRCVALARRSALMMMVPALGLLGGLGAPNQQGAKSSHSSSSGVPLRLTSIRVTGIDQKSGQLIDDVDQRSWNELNLSLLAIIEMSGSTGTLPRSTVEVTVKKGSRVVQRERQTIGAMENASDHCYVPVLIHGPLCDTVTIEARVVGQRDVRPLMRRIAFRCGE